MWGPSGVVFVFGYCWFMTFIDCFSHMTWVYLLHNKTDVFSCFKMFYKKVVKQFDAKVRILRTDNRGESVDGELQAYIAKN